MQEDASSSSTTSHEIPISVNSVDGHFCLCPSREEKGLDDEVEEEKRKRRINHAKGGGGTGWGFFCLKKEVGREGGGM